MHWKKREINTDKKHSKVELRYEIVVKPARNYWEPIIKPGKNRKHGAH